MKGKSLPADLLKRYLADTCTEAERRKVDEWYFHLDREQEAAPHFFNEQELLQRIRADIAHTLPTPEEAPVVPLKRWWYLGGIAASLLLLLGVGYLAFNRQAADPYTASVPDTADWTVHSNSTKKIERYSFPDQSIVWLQPGARLSHPAAFMQSDFREVRFAGEGFFEVVRDTLHPFIIYSGTLKTQVLGTSFNVKAYENDASYHVSVLTGSVAVSTPASSSRKEEVLVLKTNEQATYQNATRSLTLEPMVAKTEKKLPWQPASLVFNDTPLSEAVIQLQRAFQIKIELTNQALNTCRLTVDFNKQRLPEILEMINTLLGSTYELEGDTIRIFGEGCSD
ncbi:FecR family protein [Persicitalea jodogahamensis]|uniref:FecR family protein n=1 Tax=Persicitalea jodogahamensis TaxID=402147 RepID=A0A8J3GA17_9BACT|nr:FecR domain-containing protein [Persicitalea jodogahamensis]GHB70926.1 hypothetical protein GCM10007390_25820 [Persicitalea jodogahamensis]